MATFVKGYIEPGVYVESEIKPTPVIGTVGNFVPVLIGTWDPYTRTKSDAITKGSSDSDLVKLNGENVDVTLVDTTRGSVINLTTSDTYTIDTNRSKVLLTLCISILKNLQMITNLNSSIQLKWKKLLTSWVKLKLTILEISNIYCL